MPFRDRVRKAFGRTPSETTSSTTTVTASSSQRRAPKQRPGNEGITKRNKAQRADVYRIGDPMPPPKYPGKWDRPHQEMLRAFSFANAFSRRRSEQTEVSPMNSRWHSRKNSEVAPAGGRRSIGQQRGPSNMANGETANGNVTRPDAAERAHRRNAYVVIGVDAVVDDVHLVVNHDSLADGRTSESSSNSAYYTADESYVDRHDDDDDISMRERVDVK